MTEHSDFDLLVSLPKFDCDARQSELFDNILAMFCELESLTPRAEDLPSL